MPVNTAAQLHDHLTSLLAVPTRQALQAMPQLREGSWAIDIWDERYNSVLQVVRVDHDAGLVAGFEYDFAPGGVESGKLQCCSSGAVLSEQDLLELPLPSLHKVTVLSKSTKGRWSRSSCHKQPKIGKPLPKADWWLYGGRPVRELKWHSEAYELCLADGKEIDVTAASSADWYSALAATKESSALEAIQYKWNLEEEQAKAIVRAMWSTPVIPKLKTFLWLLVLQALPTMERCGDWLTAMASAVCPHCPTPSLNTLDHVFCTCKVADIIWTAFKELFAAKLGLTVNLSVQFLLLHSTNRAEERALRKEKWWQQLRAWLLCGLWVDWAACTFRLKNALPPVQIANQAWKQMSDADLSPLVETSQT